jgi:hypothetical protein
MKYGRDLKTGPPARVEAGRDGYHQLENALGFTSKCSDLLLIYYEIRRNDEKETSSTGRTRGAKTTYPPRETARPSRTPRLPTRSAPHNLFKKELRCSEPRNLPGRNQ